MSDKLRIKLLKPKDFMGVRREAGAIIEDVKLVSHDEFSVQLGFGSWIYLKNGIDAEEYKETQ